MAVTDDAISRIREMILSGELKPGDRLDPEKELSERLGLSRSSLREAVKALELVRVLDVRRGNGTYVTSLEPALLSEAISFIVDLHHDASVLELFEVRRILEPAAAELAAQRRAAADLDAMRASIERARSATEVEELVQHDLEFHAIIARSSGNQYLATVLEGLASSTVRARVWRGITEQNSVDRTLEEHSALVREIERGDAMLARSLMVLHVSGVESWLRKANDVAAADEGAAADAPAAVDAGGAARP